MNTVETCATGVTNVEPCRQSECVLRRDCSRLEGNKVRGTTCPVGSNVRCGLEVSWRNSPSPLIPLPLGEGDGDRTMLGWRRTTLPPPTHNTPKAGGPFSLSRRERAGVRGNGPFAPGVLRCGHGVLPQNSPSPLIPLPLGEGDGNRTMLGWRRITLPPPTHNTPKAGGPFFLSRRERAGVRGNTSKWAFPSFKLRRAALSYSVSLSLSRPSTVSTFF